MQQIVADQITTESFFIQQSAYGIGLHTTNYNQPSNKLLITGAYTTNMQAINNNFARVANENNLLNAKIQQLNTIILLGY